VILGRRTQVTDEPDFELVEDDVESTLPAGKGRPTPKRAQARKARRNATPKDRKEAAKMRREKGREQRRATQAAMAGGGDDRNLPARDAGPARRLARDVVDSRFTYGQVLFGLIFGVLILSFVPSPAVKEIANVVALLSLMVMGWDGVRNGRRAHRAVSEKFGEAAARGITSYALMRALMPRRFRRPPPRVARGDQV
jgi:hypothetical protein